MRAVIWAKTSLPPKKSAPTTILQSLCKSSQTASHTQASPAVGNLPGGAALGGLRPGGGPLAEGVMPRRSRQTPHGGGGLVAPDLGDLYGLTLLINDACNLAHDLICCITSVPHLSTRVQLSSTTPFVSGNYLPSTVYLGFKSGPPAPYQSRFGANWSYKDIRITFNTHTHTHTLLLVLNGYSYHTPPPRLQISPISSTASISNARHRP